MALLHCPKDRKEKSYQFRDERTQLFSHWSLDSTAVTPATDPPLGNYLSCSMFCCFVIEMLASTSLIIQVWLIYI